MKLGNIIYQGDLVNHEKVEYINYIKEPVQVPDELPTLYVGWFMMKELNLNNPLIAAQSILDKKVITDKLYWEFSFKENKAQHVDGISNFVRNVPYHYFKPQYGYVNLDPVFFRLSSIEDLNDYLSKSYGAIYNYKGEMLYLLTNNSEGYRPIENTIIGVDLNMYEHFEFDMDKLIENLHKRVPIDHIYNDFDGEIYLKHYKIYPNFDDLKRYLVVLLTKA